MGKIWAKMKGKRDMACDWPQELGLAILEARRPLYERLSFLAGIPQPYLFWRSHAAIGAFMGISGEAVRLIERRAMRKMRIRLDKELCQHIKG